MIKIEGRKLNIQDNERFIGLEGDNKYETRQFEITEARLFNFDFRLEIKRADGIKDIAYLDKVVESDRIVLTWEVLEKNIGAGGWISIQLCANGEHGEAWNSIPEMVRAKSSINASEAYPDPLPSEFEQIEQRVTAIQSDVIEKAAEVEADRAEVATNTATVLEKTAEALQSAANALVSEQNAHKSADNAKDSETTAYEAMQTAVQAMQDLLNMLGTDIATLTGGKLTPSQIPAIAITDTFVVATEEAMLALDCETGDICIRTDENKTYILQGTDPSILSDWQQLKTPTNYADEAGHAVTADNAENANKINNKRLVAMTETQYENAVKDPDTLYVVVTDEE